MFKFLSTREQLIEEKRKNEAMKARLIELEEAAVELAEIVAMNEEEIQHG